MTATHTRRSFFGWGLLAFVVLALAGLFVGLRYLWGSLEAYEAATPAHAIGSYFDSLVAGETDQLLAESGFEASPLNTEADYLAALRQIFGTDYSGLLYLKTASSQPEVSCYTVCRGDAQLGVLDLTATGDEAHPWKVTARVPYLEGWTIEAPAFLTVQAGGAPLPDAWRQSDAQPVAGYTAMPEAFPVPTVARYQTEPTLAEPVFTASAPDGTEPVMSVDTARRTVTFSVPVPAEQTEAYAALVTEPVKLYARFITEDATFQDLAGLLLPDTAFYKSIRTFFNGWYIDHDSYAFENLSVEGLSLHDQDHFSGDISFDYVIKKGAKAYTYPSAYRAFFVRVDGVWKLANLETK